MNLRGVRELAAPRVRAQIGQLAVHVCTSTVAVACTRLSQLKYFKA